MLFVLQGRSLCQTFIQQLEVVYIHLTVVVHVSGHFFRDGDRVLTGKIAVQLLHVLYADPAVAVGVTGGKCAGELTAAIHSAVLYPR